MEAKKIHVITSYTMSVNTEIELPEGKTEEDISGCWVKWGEIHIDFKDETETTANESTPEFSDGDWKRPGAVEVRKDKDGYADFEADEIYSD